MIAQFAEHDAAIRAWFDARGWPVTSTNDDFHRDISAWRYQAGCEQYTLRFTRRVLEDVPAKAVPVLLDSLKAERALRTHPAAYTVVRGNNGRPVLDQLIGPPERDD
jgi:hypothetical protein